MVASKIGKKPAKVCKMPETFELIQRRTLVVKEGWGVNVTPIYGGEEFDQIVEIDVNVVEIRRELCSEVGGVWCVADIEGISFVPVENFQDVSDLTQDDTHDLRTRWFATEFAARIWAESVRNRWDHPQPWESFVCLQ